MEESFSRRGGAWVLGQTGLMLLVLALGVLFPQPTPGGWGFWIGAVVVALGGWLGLAAVWALGPARTAFPRPLRASALVQTGPYRIVRHPIYLSVLLLGMGWSAGWGSGAALIGTVALGVLLHFKSVAEERWLIEKFPEYAEYARRVGRLVPGIF